MYSIISFSLLGASLLGASTAAPFSLPDGFPSPNAQQIIDIQVRAHGTLPNTPAPPPGYISAKGLANLRLIQFNENFEVAYFSSLLANLTSNAAGYTISDAKQRKIVIDAITAVVAQEELHSLQAGGALKSQNHAAILPCQYKFPATTFVDAITLASTFTDVVLGTLQDATQIFGATGSPNVTRGIASIIAQEGEQNGFYRYLQDKGLIPSALPFLTTSVGDFAYSALQMFVVKGTCPNADLISKDVKIFGVLELLTKNPQPVNQNLKFSFDLNTLQDSNISIKNSKGYDWNQAGLAYINQQNKPVVVKLQNVQTAGSVVTFEAPFAYTQYLLNGLTLAAVTINQGPFADAQAVADATLFGPGLIEVN